MPFLLIFAALPLIEIALFIAVGSNIGVLPVIGLIVASAFLGVSVLRGQSERARDLMRGGMRVAPGFLLAQGAFRLVAGLLLIIPGFLTDTIGLLLLVPLVQKALLAWIAARATVATVHTWQQDDIIEGEFEVREPGRPADPHPPTIEDRRGH